MQSVRYMLPVDCVKVPAGQAVHDSTEPVGLPYVLRGHAAAAPSV
jgi:hypothetical protein